MPIDAFDILGVPPAFDLDPERLNQAYLIAAAAIHPDLAAGSETAPHRMAEVNQARRALANPEMRADLLLKRLGGPAAEQEKGLPPQFLAEMMSVREQIQDALGQIDPGKREQHRRHWESWARAERQRATREVSEMFRSVPAEAASRTGPLKQIRIRLNAWRYVERLIEQLDPNFNARAGM